MNCPQCDCYHEDSGRYCSDCLADLRIMLESRDIEVVTAVTEWMQSSLVSRELPATIECPKCMNEFEVGGAA